MIAKSLRRLGLAAALAGLSMLMAAGVAAQTDDGDGDEGLKAERASTWMDDESARERRLVENLRTSAAPRDWALASQMSPLPDAEGDDFMDAMQKAQADHAELLRTAALAAPDDKLVQWFALFRMPNASGGCSSSAPPQARIDAVQRLEPDNGLALLPTLKQAIDAGNPVDIDTVLARIAAAPHYDDHVVDHTRALIDVAVRYPESVARPPFVDAQKVSDGDLAFVSALMAGHAGGMAVYALGDVCNAVKQTDADLRRFAACADIGRRLSREAANVGLRMSGFYLLRQSAQYDDDDAAAEREVQWRVAQAVQLAERDSARVVSEAKQAWLAQPDDLAALKTLLERHGISASPPIGWQPASPDAEE